MLNTIKKLIDCMKTDNDFWSSRIKEWTVLNVPDRLSEVLFGLIMVLAFTGTISAANSGEQEVKELIWAALGCNLAWGIVDGVMNTMDTIIARSRNRSLWNKIMVSTSSDVSPKILRDNISPLFSELLNDDEVDHLGDRMKQLPEPGLKNVLNTKDLLIAFQIFFIVFLSTFPVALPFILIDDVAVAIRVSNGVVIVLLFIAGYALGTYSGLRPFITALGYAALGLFLVALTILLGG